MTEATISVRDLLQCLSLCQSPTLATCLFGDIMSPNKSWVFTSLLYLTSTVVVYRCKTTKWSLCQILMDLAVYDFCRVTEQKQKHVSDLSNSIVPASHAESKHGTVKWQGKLQWQAKTSNLLQNKITLAASHILLISALQANATILTSAPGVFVLQCRCQMPEELNAHSWTRLNSRVFQSQE